MQTRWSQARGKEAHEEFEQYLEGLEDPAERRKSEHAEKNLFTTEVLGEYGARMAFAEGECDPNDHCHYRPHNQAVSPQKATAPRASSISAQ